MTAHINFKERLRKHAEFIYFTYVSFLLILLFLVIQGCFLGMGDIVGYIGVVGSLVVEYYILRYLIKNRKHGGL